MARTLRHTGKYENQCVKVPVKLLKHLSPFDEKQLVMSGVDIMSYAKLFAKFSFRRDPNYRV